MVYYVIDRCRGSPVVKKFLGQFFAGVLITDFYGAYNSLVVAAKQRCTAHLLRELLKVDQTNTTTQWCGFKKKLCRLLRDALRLKEKRLVLAESVFEHKKEKIYQRFYLLCSHPYEDKDCRRLSHRLKRHRHELFTFLERPDVPADNNHAERQIRPAVIARKNSYNNRSLRGANTQAVMMSLFRTLHIRGAEPIETIMKLIEKALISNKQLTLSENTVSVG